MTRLISRKSVTVGAALSIPCFIALWMMAVPEVVSASTFAFAAAGIVGGAAVSLISWRNAQPTGSVGELLYTTEQRNAAAGIDRKNV